MARPPRPCASRLDAAPAVPGRIGEAPFAWLADADTRLGPVLEVIVNGRYAWLPMSNLRSLKVEAPSDLRDLVWLPAELTLANGGATVALLPARYAETVEHGDDAARLGRKTEWLDSGLPVGQRLFVTDAGETALFDLRELDFEPRDA